MDAVLFYVDDWMSSGSVAEMDAHEERGYFRLLLHSAKQADCGLPSDEAILALRSMLRSQWKKESKDEDFRFGKTSGQKVLECFFVVRDGACINAGTGAPVTLDAKSEIDISQLQEGRIYNERLLKVFFEFRRRQQRAVDAANKRWGNNACGMPKHPETMPEHKKAMLEQCSEHATRVENENKNSSSSSSSLLEKPSKISTSAQSFPSIAGSEGWEELIEVSAIARLSHDPSPSSDLCTKVWCRMDMGRKMEIVQSIRQRISCGEFGPEANPQYIPTLENYIVKTKYRQTLRPRMNVEVMVPKRDVMAEARELLKSQRRAS